MKLLKYTTLACALFASSCSTSFLEVEPIGQLGKDQLFTDVNGMRDGLVGSYSLAAVFFQSEYGIYGDLRADDVNRVIGGTQTYMNADYNYSFDENDQLGATQEIWSMGYELLNNINNVLEAAPALTLAQPHRVNEIQVFEGQARVLRALTFLALANVYSQHYTFTADASHPGIPLPLVSPLPSETLGRATVKETYAQIVIDLQQAILLLEGTPQQTRIYASADAAKALLSRVYLYMEDYAQVISHSSSVLSTGKFLLTEAADYVRMFNAAGQFADFNSIDKEVIWQLSLTTQSSKYMSSFYSDRTAFLAFPSSTLLSLYDDQDVRKTVFEFQAAANQYMSLKNAKELALSDVNWPINTKVIRSAELYLNRAEAYAKTGQLTLAEADLKAIVARAHHIAVDDVVLTYSTAEDLLELIKKERRKELAFEGQRIFDIMRYKESLDRGALCSSGTCALSYPNALFILPIPKAELDANKQITPNPIVNN